MHTHNDWSPILATVAWLLLLPFVAAISVSTARLGRFLFRATIGRFASHVARRTQRRAGGAPPALPVQLKKPLPPEKSDLAGPLLWSLLANMNWVQRRIERFEMIDSRTARRSISVDFTIPAEHLKALTDEELGKAMFVPLGLLAKKPLKAFDLRDEGGVPLPLMTTEQNGRLAAAALLSCAGVALNLEVADGGGKHSRRLDELGEEFQELTTASVPGARAQRERWEAAARRNQTDSDHAWATLLGNDAFRSLAKAFTDSFVLAAVAPLSPGVRRIIKFSYEESIEPNVRWWRRAMRALAWSHAAMVIDVPGASQAASYHFEAPAPVDLEINESFFEFAPPEGHTEDVASPDTSEALCRPLQCEERQAGRLTHLHADRVDPRLTARVVVRFRASRTGFLHFALATAFVVWILLALCLCRLHDVITNAGAAVPLLVVVPGILTAVVVRPGEHALASTFFIGVRVVVSLAVLSALVVAAALVDGLDYNTLYWVWVGAAGVASVCLCCLVVSNAMPPPARPAGYRWT